MCSPVFRPVAIPRVHYIEEALPLHTEVGRVAVVVTEGYRALLELRRYVAQLLQLLLAPSGPHWSVKLYEGVLLRVEHLQRVLDTACDKNKITHQQGQGRTRS